MLLPTSSAILKLSAIIIAALLIYIGFLHFQISGLKLELSEQRAAVTIQNNQVRRWKREADQRKQETQAAIDKAKALGVIAERRVKVIRDTDAQTCKEGVSLIDEALGL